MKNVAEKKIRALIQRLKKSDLKNECASGK